MSNPIPAVAYYRMSTDKQEESIPQQQASMRPKCKLADIDLVKEFQDEGISGGKMAKRDAFKDMLAFCQQQRRQGKPIEAIVCWDTKRFSRATSIETNHYLWEFMQAGVCRLFTSSDGWIDLRREDHRVLFNLRQDISNNRDQRSRSMDTCRGKMAVFQAGYWNGGVAPYGFDRIIMDENRNPVQRLARTEKIKFMKKGWHIVLTPTDNPEVIETLRWLFDRYARTETSMHGLCGELNRKGVPGPGSGTRQYVGKTGWKVGSLLRIFENPVYMGDLRYGLESRGSYYRIIKDDKTKEVKADEVLDIAAGVQYQDDPAVAPETHDGIIDRATWNMVQAKLKARRVNHLRPRAGGFVLPGDLVRCGHCGAKMFGLRCKSGGRRTREYRYYACSGNQVKPGSCHYLRIREDALLPFLIAKIRDWYLHPDRLEKLRQKLRQKAVARHQGEPDRAGRLKKRIAELDADIRRGAQNLIRASTHLDLIEQELTTLRSQRDKVAQDLDAAEAAQGISDEDVAAKVDAAVARLYALKDQLADPQPERLRATMRQLVSRIDLYFQEWETPSRRLWYRFAKGIIKLRPQLDVAGTGGVSNPVGSGTDVLTTGTTASEAARALRSAGAAVIIVAVLARPSPRSASSSHSPLTQPTW
jgi:DNA invertase Pin-like site-specific DNA recombinase